MNCCCKKNSQTILTILYSTNTIGYFPIMNEQLPKSWKYNGFEGTMKGDPKWTTNSAYYSGMSKFLDEAKEKITNIYENYKKQGLVENYEFRISAYQKV